jgi:hypothetical protein
MCHSILLVHSTPARNVSSIFRRGLLPQLASGKLRVVWVCQRRLSRWSKSHVSRRHHVPAGQVAALLLQLPQDWLKKHGPGVFTCARVVPPSAIIGVNALQIVA